MPVIIEIIGHYDLVGKTIEKVFDYFNYVDQTFSTYKPDSEIMRINRGDLLLQNASEDMKEIFILAEKTKNETDGFFNITNGTGLIDPSGIIKGWAINNAANFIHDAGLENYYVEAGGDIEVNGSNEQAKDWSIGIKNPLKDGEYVKVLYLANQGIATSGTYLRGQHIYNPHDRKEIFNDIVSLTVIGPNVYEADRFATAAFAMGRKGIEFIEKLNTPSQPRRFEGYMIDSKGIGTMTSDFEKLTIAATIKIN